MELDLGKPMGIKEKITYRFFWTLAWIVAKTFFRFSTVNKDRLPKDTPYILSPVHRSYIDSPLGGLITKQRVRFLGKESLWNNRLGGWFVGALGCFPVQRGTADRAALRACQQVLERGEPLVMFPEGTRRSGPKVKDENMFSGPAFVAARAGVPLIPLGIAGTDKAMPHGARFFRPAKVFMVVGQPVLPPEFEGRVPRQAVDDLTEQLRQSLQEAYDQAQTLLAEKS
ncbi:MAG: lysophospholipid acyltransferase family protein [Actinomycetota bacterium]|nr:lysophospholipid acyltransferase family protein [Actinomycetota bacterium]|tara:strand:+ start:9363 stop:10043 length:681 start_codon:yes stop_codon:yes gene_type:complete